MTRVKDSLLVRGLCAVLATGLMIDRAAAVTINLTFDSAASDSPSFDATGANLTPIFEQAASYWEDIIEDWWTLDIEYYYDDLNDPDSYLGLHNNLATSGGKPTEARIRVDTQLYGVERDWWFDPTPASHTEFDLEQTLYRDLTPGEQSAWFGGSPPEVLEVGFRGPAVAGGAADGHLDVLSTVIHEMGHALGLTGNVASGEVDADGDYDAPASMVRGTNTDILEAAPENYHIADGVALMCSSCGAASLRRMPTATDVLAIAAASGWTNVDLPRQDFLGGSDWNDGYNWEGGNPPGTLDDAFIRLQGSDVTANLSANGFAANLFVGEGDNVDTESFKLDVVDTATVDGLDSDIMVRDGGELEADRVVIQNQAEVFMTGGLLDANRVTVGADSFLTATSSGLPTVDVQTDLTNDGTIQATADATLTLTSSGGAVWNLDGAGDGIIRAVTGDVNFASGSMTDAFDGDMIVGAGRNLSIAEPWELGPGGVIDLNGGSEPADAARLAPGGLVTAQDGRIDATGDARILPDVAFGSGIQVSVPGASDSLALYGTVTYDGGSYTGAGTIYQVAEATVSGNTTIDVATYDWDGGSGTSTTLISGATFTINSSNIDVGSSASDGYDGEVTVLAGALDVNTDAPWRLDGTMTLSSGVVRGQDLRVFGALSANPFFAGTTNTIEADVTFEPGSTVAVGTDSTLNLDGQTIYDGTTATGVGTLVQNGHATVRGNTTIDVALYDWDGAGGGSTTTIEPGVTLTINSDQIEAGSPAVDGYDGIVYIDSGATLAVNTDAPWRLDGILTMDNVGEIPSIGGSQIVVYGDLSVSTGEAHVNSAIELRASASVSLPDSTELELNGPTTFHGGAYTGAGLLRQDGEATVQSSTTIGVGTYDMDGTFGTTVITLNEPLTLDVNQIDTVGTSFDGTVNVNNPGTLTVNTPGPWLMAGTANLDQNGHPNTYLIRGSDVTISGRVNVTGDTAIGARIDLTGEINLGDPGDFIQLGGNRANTIDGGQILGPGVVSSVAGSLTGNGSITADVQFLNSADLLAAGGTLAVSGTIVEVGTVGTAAGSGVLKVAHNWNTDVADRLELGGGEVTGAGITNGGLTTGHGLLTPAYFDNNGTLTAAGGTLIVQPATFPDLDGAGAENGTIDTGKATIHVPGDLGGLFNFNGTLATQPGGEFRMDFGGLIIRSGADPGRMKMNGGRYSAPRFRQQSELTVDTATATIDSDSDFEDGSTNTLAADLQLLGTARIHRGASLTGSADLVVGPGASLYVEHAATLDVDLVNRGTLHVGFSPAAVRLGHDYLQADDSMLAIEIGGHTPGSEHDQLQVADRLDLTAAGDAMLLEWLPSDAASMFGGKYEVATYGSQAGQFDVVGGGIGPFGIGKAYVAGVDYGSGANDSIFLSLHDLLPGDADLDGDVDFGDYMILEAAFGGAGEFKDGDFDLNGVVDFGDYM
ncbi:MAG: hypothetical protein HQ567_00925, partial [Candidatus Nealsonbacteria bacterium]|nr:hypothetical protein [Candidatus Nealsonbacteria bacterium]